MKKSKVSQAWALVEMPRKRIQQMTHSSSQAISQQGKVKTAVLTTASCAESASTKTKKKTTH